jgi:hypothetical protein
MSQKLSVKEAWIILKQVHLIMQVPRFGKMSPTTLRVTFGLLVVYSMKWSAFDHHFKQVTWVGSIRELLEDSFQKYLRLILMIFGKWCVHFSKLTLKIDLIASKYKACQAIRNVLQSYFLILPIRIRVSYLRQ